MQPDLSLAMDSMQQLCGAAFSLHYVLLLAASGFPKTLFDHFVRQLESFLFYYIFTKTPTKDLERNFSLWADDLREIGGLADEKTQRNKLNEFSSMQQYRTRYLLAKLTQSVEMAFKGMTTPGALAEFAALEIEHMLSANFGPCAPSRFWTWRSCLRSRASSQKYPTRYPTIRTKLFASYTASPMTSHDPSRGTTAYISNMSQHKL
jgi:hypothetical protein